jgi:hypothetical protein
MAQSLQSLIAAEALQPVDPRVSAFAAELAQPFGDTARAVIFYGSCLREAQLDGLMLDFYVIVSDYAAAYRAVGKGGWMARANALIPPNVFPAAHDNLAAKYAVLSEADLARACSMQAGDVSVWARFSQPVRLVWSADDAARDSVVDALADAVVTLFHHSLSMMGHEAVTTTHLDLWRRGYALTYGAELRAERNTRSGSIVDSDPDRYQRVGNAALARIADTMGVGPAGEVPLLVSNPDMERRWKRLRRRGKTLTVLRLAKASFTFAGGIDYLAWKINRHAGTQIAIKPWQRKWPLVAAVFLVPKLLRSGAVK